MVLNRDLYDALTETFLRADWCSYPGAQLSETDLILNELAVLKFLKRYGCLDSTEKGFIRERVCYLEGKFDSIERPDNTWATLRRKAENG